MAGGVEIDAVFEGKPQFQKTLEDKVELVVVKMPGCCEICAANEDPDPILAGGLHVNCRCGVEIEVIEEA